MDQPLLNEQQASSPATMNKQQTTTTTTTMQREERGVQQRSVGAADHEWTFSIRVPHDRDQQESEATGGATDPALRSTTQLVQMVQTQSHEEPSTARRARRRESEEDVRGEDASLLLNGTITDDAEKLELDPSIILDGGGWTFQSPYWNLHAADLLRVTYFPAWQALPAYTNCRHTTFLSCPLGCSSRCCSCTSQIDYMSYTFTSADVVHVQHIPNYEVRGIGPCQAVRLQLRPLPLLGELFASIPLHLQDAWQQQLSQIRDNRRARNMPEPSSPADDHGVRGPILTMCLPSAQIDAPLLWRVQFPALTHPIAIETLTMLDGALVVPRQRHPTPTHIYINGYQSWSFAGSIPRGHKQPTSAMPDVFSRAFNYGASIPPPADGSYREYDEADTPFPMKQTTLPPLDVHYTSDFFTCITSDGQVPDASRLAFLMRKSSAHSTPYQLLDETGGPALLLGWLSQRQQFGVITSDKDLRRFQMHASCHGQLLIRGLKDVIATDWAYAQLISKHSYDEEPMAHFLHAVAARNDARPLQNGSLLTGWCSWYFAYERISARLLRDNFAKLAGLKSVVPTNVSVVDDGYMSAWGDWDSLKARQFPDGMDVVSRDISEHGMRPGLWMAPFAADKHSKIAAQNPDWIIRNHAGAVANSSNCGKFFYGLDTTNPRVREYVHHCVQRAVENWGFNVLKIDFLYAACLEGNGKFDLTMSRAEAMDLALRTIRDAAGSDVFLIGCGCPIASAIGSVDAMRISADTGPTWYPPPPLPWWDMGTLPSLRSMVRNSISRAPFGHRWWHNDPDCLMFGEHTRLTNDEVASAASVVAMTCGMLLLSDDLPKVPEARTQILSKIFPMTGVSAVVLDLHSTNNGLPSLMRLWCTDRYNVLDPLRRQLSGDSTDDGFDHNAEATFLARQASFRPDEALSSPDERKRSCIHVTKGLGTWTVVSISNWLDKADVVHVPPFALLPAPTSGWGTESDDGSRDEEKTRDYVEHGYHVLAFWSSRYSWLPPFARDADPGPEHTIGKRLGPHATEIFHIRPVTPDAPQYLGSDLHFSCGFELRCIRAGRDRLSLRLRSEYRRAGRIFVFVPRTTLDNLRVTVNGTPGRPPAVVGNTPVVGENGSPRLLGRVIAIPVVVCADGSERDGHIEIEF